MELAISNIAWGKANDEEIYHLMIKYSFSGLEIAPTRIFPQNPYEKLTEAKKWVDEIKSNYGFVVPSMQSIWFGRPEKIFGTEEERQILVDYTKKAIDFASAISCKNLVFGCPRNRNLSEGIDESLAIEFFKKIGDYAVANGTVIGMEANPPIYNTNYINDTESAFNLIEQVKSDGFKLNLDLGTIIYNDEDISELVGRVHMVNHVHISEPGLKPIEMRTVHGQLRDILINEGYQGYVSIEMGKVDDISLLEAKLEYVRRIFE